jgi:hypothetical protein
MHPMSPSIRSTNRGWAARSTQRYSLF